MFLFYGLYVGRRRLDGARDEVTKVELRVESNANTCCSICEWQS